MKTSKNQYNISSKKKDGKYERQSMHMRKEFNMSLIGIPEESTERIEQKQYLKKGLPKLHYIIKSHIHEAQSKKYIKKQQQQQDT